MQTIYLIRRPGGALAIEVAGDVDRHACQPIVGRLQADLRYQSGDSQAEDALRQAFAGTGLSVERLPDTWDPVTSGRQMRFQVAADVASQP